MKMFINAAYIAFGVLFAPFLVWLYPSVKIVVIGWGYAEEDAAMWAGMICLLVGPAAVIGHSLFKLAELEKRP